MDPPSGVFGFTGDVDTTPLLAFTGGALAFPTPVIVTNMTAPVGRVMALGEASFDGPVSVTVGGPVPMPVDPASGLFQINALSVMGGAQTDDLLVADDSHVWLQAGAGGTRLYGRDLVLRSLPSEGGVPGDPRPGTMETWMRVGQSGAFFHGDVTIGGALLGPSGAYVGPQGPQGSQGPQGIEGPVGSQGPQGIEGPVGSQGPQGVQGPVGSQGPQGVQGPVGSQGPVGTQGPQGPQGVAGVGAPGPAGSTGHTGPTGADSTVPGPTGPTGANSTVAGPAGADSTVPGPTGPTGSAGVLSVSTTTDAENNIVASLVSQALSIDYANLLTRLATFVTSSSLTSTLASYLTTSAASSDYQAKFLIGARLLFNGSGVLQSVFSFGRVTITTANVSRSGVGVYHIDGITVGAGAMAFGGTGYTTGTSGNRVATSFPTFNRLNLFVFNAAGTPVDGDAAVFTIP